MSKRESYTAADAVPYKLFLSDAMGDIRAGRIPPAHIQFIPTNRCNLKCSFCSCDNRARGEEMPIDEIREMASGLRAIGTEAATITGGGEPLLHKDFDDILEAFDGIATGLVTNGTLLGYRTSLRTLTWCRISAADERPLSGFVRKVEAALQAAPDVDWAFSYVLSDTPNIPNLQAHIDFAEHHGFTHVRVVADLLDTDSVPMDEAREAIGENPVVIWQPRTEHEQGMRECRIAELKPVIGPDGSVYPCCGVQYATDPPSLDLTDSMRMGHWRDMPLPAFDGRMCVRCYYGAYNRALGALTGGVEHGAFL